MRGDTAGHDAREMFQIRFDIDRYAMEADPAAQPDADGGDLVLGRRSVGQGGRLRPRDPNADTVLTALALDIHAVQRIDHPGFQCRDEGPHIAAAALEIEHDIGDPLSRPVIGVFAATARPVNRKPARRQQVRLIGAGSCGIERRVFDQPDQLVGRSPCDGFGTAFHERHRLFVVGQPGRHEPAHRR